MGGFLLLVCFYPSLNLRLSFAEGSVVIRLMRLVKKTLAKAVERFP